jgi:hypothetical protein
MFVNIINKAILSLCAFLLITTLSFAYLSYKFYGDIQESSSIISSLESANKDYRDKLKLIEESYAIADSVGLQTHKTRAEAEAVGYIGVEAIDALSGCKPVQAGDFDRSIEQEVGVNESKTHQTRENANVANITNTPTPNVAHIDDLLPSELANILHNTFSNLQDRNSVSSSPK